MGRVIGRQKSSADRERCSASMRQDQRASVATAQQRQHRNQRHRQPSAPEPAPAPVPIAFRLPTVKGIQISSAASARNSGQPGHVRANGSSSGAPPAPETGNRALAPGRTRSPSPRQARRTTASSSDSAGAPRAPAAPRAKTPKASASRKQPRMGIGRIGSPAIHARRWPCSTKPLPPQPSRNSRRHQHGGDAAHAPRRAVVQSSQQQRSAKPAAAAAAPSPSAGAAASPSTSR